MADASVSNDTIGYPCQDLCEDIAVVHIKGGRSIHLRYVAAIIMAILCLVDYW
jgi:hypothetical protein